MQWHADEWRLWDAAVIHHFSQALAMSGYVSVECMHWRFLAKQYKLYSYDHQPNYNSKVYARQKTPKPQNPKLFTSKGGRFARITPNISQELRIRTQVRRPQRQLRTISPSRRSNSPQSVRRSTILHPVHQRVQTTSRIESNPTLAVISTRGRKEAIIVLNAGIDLHSLSVVVLRAVEEDQRILHAVPGNHLAARLLEIRQIGIASPDDGAVLVDGLAEMTNVLRVRDVCYVQGRVAGQEDLLPVCGDLEWDGLAVLRGQGAVRAGQTGQSCVVRESVPQG